MAINSSSQPDAIDADESQEYEGGATSAVASDREGEDKVLLEQEQELTPLHETQRLGKNKAGDYHPHYHRLRQKKFATQRSILKNSQDNTTPNEDQELIEAKKQILRRRRLFSHYRQYEQWRRRQFSYDPCYIRALPPPVPICGGPYDLHSSNPNAFRRRRQYRRQYSCADGSREDSRDSRDSSQLAKCHSMGARTDSSLTCNQTTTTNPATERHSFDSSECGALAYQPLHCSREEHSASISERITRSRINSAIFVSSEGRGFDSIEFLRRHGSQSVLCRKAKSAENITDNGRKKSFAENRQWHTDDSTGQDAQNDNAIELQECSRSVENHPIAALKTNVEKLLAATSVLNHSATVTTSNKVVGSISIETPPSHIREEQQRAAAILIPPPPAPPLICTANSGSYNSTSHDSADTVEELVSIPIEAVTITPATPAANTGAADIMAAAFSAAASTNANRSRVLVHQRSSTASPILSSAHSSPKALKLKCITPKLNNLPMVSVSGPSPSDEKPPPSDCL